MQAPKRFIVKMFAQNQEVVDIEAFAPIFQRWIQERFTSDELLIDVADYKHVHHGPGIILIGHDGDYSYDLAHGKHGIQYLFKQVQAESLSDAVSIAINRVIAAVEKAEAESALNDVVFDKTTVQILLLDRLNYPNDEQTAKTVETVLTSLAKSAFSDDVAINVSPVDPREPLTITFVGKSAISRVELLSAKATS